MTRALGLDIGLSGVRATVVDATGALIASAVVRDPVRAADGRAEHDPARWWAAVQRTARDAVAASGPVDAIAIGALGPAPFLVDTAGTPLTTALCFSLDVRAEAERAALGADVTHDHALAKVQWLAARTPGAAMAIDVAGWIAWRLTGRPVMDAISRLQFVHELASSPVPLPDEVDPRGVVGGLVADIGLPRGTPVFAGTLDSYVDVVAAGCTGSGDGCVLLGSTLIVYGIVPAPVAVAGLELQRYPGDGYLLGGSTSSGGNVLEWAREVYGEAIEPSSGGVRALPYLAGERTPVRDPDARGNRQLHRALARDDRRPDPPRVRRRDRARRPRSRRADRERHERSALARVRRRGAPSGVAAGDGRCDRDSASACTARRFGCGAGPVRPRRARRRRLSWHG